MIIKEKKGMKKWNNAEIVALDLNKTENGWHDLWTEGECICILWPHKAITGDIPTQIGNEPQTTGDQPTGNSGTTTDRLS